MKTEENLLIDHVSDTALWVAHYRAEESERKDALFHDPFAKTLVGERGRKIAEAMAATSKYTRWTLTIRTYVIDRLIEKLISQGIDTIINLGAGLDTRPYRMSLPQNLLWIEVDYPHMIEHKEKFLEKENPSCRLERVRLDLADRDKRRSFFSQTVTRSKNILIITEGVIPYLTENQVAELATDLHSHESFRFWITEYFAPQVYPYINDPKRMKQMKNAPFSFFPSDWFGFFKKYGWSSKEIKYLGEESIKLNRKIPGPWWAFIFIPFIKKESVNNYLRYTGYVVFGRD